MTERRDIKRLSLMCRDMRKKKASNMLLKMTEALDIPSEIISGIARVEVVGGRDVLIENHCGILEYGPAEIQINGGTVIIIIKGSELVIRSMTATEMSIKGYVFGVEFRY